MELGFETIGNATVIAHDGGPVVVTDPWLVGSAYFGSWGMSHQVPEEQLQNAKRCPYVWISHGHPDHLSGDTLAQMKDKKILVGDHVGSRIYNDLKQQGFDVQVLKDRTWTQLSPRIRVWCAVDFNQDSILLLDIGGKLVANLNDAGDRGWGRDVKKLIASYPISFLLALSGYGDADMINFFAEDGQPIPPPAANRTPVGQTIARMTENWGARFFVPSSSMHRYQRADSVWAAKYTTHLTDYRRGFASSKCELLPAFIRYDCLKDAVECINPPESDGRVFAPEEFGDHWDERLEKEDREKLTAYFQAVEQLGRRLDFVRFKVGGEEHVVPLRRPDASRGGYKKGVTFEAPRNSLMTAVQYEIFDDLLIGNFMKTTLHGEWGEGMLYPDFSPWIAKYADNGRAKTRAELRSYFKEYRQRDPVGYMRANFQSGFLLPLQDRSAKFLRSRLGANSKL
ncbi:MAG: MBL fold metallo-hydrolase, partial [Myxococcales bacterium]